MSSTSRFLCAPLRGVVVPLGEVPDPAFAEGALGPGVAIDPLGETLHAPCDGEVIQCAQTAHALTLRDDHGHEWLLHIGIDTVDLGGEGFELLVATGERVVAGDPLCRFDVDGLARHAKALVTPIVVTNAPDLSLETLVAPGTIVDKGETLLQWQAPGPAKETAGREVSTQASARGEATIAAAHGLHARPASRLRALAQKHAVELRLTRAEEAGKDRSGVDGASVASLSALLNLGLVRGDRVRVTARGAGAQAAVDATITLLETPEHEPGRADVSAEPATAPAVAATPGTLNGLSASPGLAVGPLVRYRAALPSVADTADDPERERRALDAAVAEVDADLERSRRAAGSRGQQAEADIFEAHRAWLDDPDLRAAAESKIVEGASAGRAWYLALETEIQRLRGSGNTLLAGRADDLHDLQRRVMQRFATQDVVATTGLEGAILAAREMTPSQFVEVAEQIAGLCLAGGGSTSHVSILARARGLPCLVAMGDALLEASGDRVCLDADQGRLELAPDERRLAAVEAEQARQRQRAEADLAAAFEPVTMRDGRRLHVAANIAAGGEAQGALDAGADGVGLMRSEFLFLARQAAPDLAEQQAEYRAAVEAMAGKPVVVRLLDIGADKQLPYLALPATPNPALGERGARLWQSHPEMFDTQLDALLEAGRGLPVCEDGLTRLRLMVPMIADAGELRWVRRRLATRAAALGIERLPSLGAMVEVPTAALCAGSLAREAEFLSIGTNDLTQYALAMDREVASLAARSDVLHPGVLRLIALCLEGAEGRCPVAVCGTAAGDPLAGALLAAMGVDELSVEPARVAAVKATLRGLDAEALAAQLPALLALDDAAAVREALATMLASSAEAATPASGDTAAADTTTRS
ncbi:phosphoenolpyruvate--protein phosphotransferase [Salinicola lusitanus]|uniref:phosphoenolpyruvate--protein phosphotransferase n=1 Tax=Salinicola lusitanus TaxID=1949085 RepID=UPI000DA2290D|nr:phosphoenolpyruvate--protein phosphotransferase [Salinicola lusitanus]